MHGSWSWLKLRQVTDVAVYIDIQILLELLGARL